VIPAEYDLLRVVYSKDCRLIAITQGDSVRKGLWKGEISDRTSRSMGTLFHALHAGRR
jgi:hypothetical protein